MKALKTLELPAFGMISIIKGKILAAVATYLMQWDFDCPSGQGKVFTPNGEQEEPKIETSIYYL